jgi:hypothetical protein
MLAARCAHIDGSVWNSVVSVDILTGGAGLVDDATVAEQACATGQAVLLAQTEADTTDASPPISVRTGEPTWGAFCLTGVGLLL